MELRSKAVWDAATVHIWRGDKDTYRLVHTWIHITNKMHKLQYKYVAVIMSVTQLVDVNTEQLNVTILVSCTFEPCKALYRWSCVTSAGQGDGPPLWHLPYWEESYGGGVRSVWRGREEKDIWGRNGDKGEWRWHTVKCKYSLHYLKNHLSNLTIIDANRRHVHNEKNLQ